MDECDPFVSAKERYGIWPTTVWEHDYSDPSTRQLKQLIGDTGEERVKNFSGSSAKATNDLSVYRGKVWGVFSPAVAAWALNMYAPDSGVCFDPFAGGGTRAIMAAKHGLHYIGVELRQDECVQVMGRCVAAGVSSMVEIHARSSEDCSDIVPTARADFLITCPPYWDLEQYDGGPQDLSMTSTYADFLKGLRRVVAETKRILKPGAMSVWVVGLHRDGDELVAMNHDVAAIHSSVGFTLHEEIVLAHKNNGAIQRVGNFEKGRQLLIRMHEYALVFRA